MAASDSARADLVRLLRWAHAGERAAALAYRGHASSVRDATERAAIRKIERDEWEHREAVGEMLTALGAGPSHILELAHLIIGRTASALCHVTGWYAPMYGAGVLEKHNVHEYDTAAAHAVDAGLPHLAPELRAMAATEREHEAWFRTRVTSHRLSRIVRPWRLPAADRLPGVDDAVAADDVNALEVGGREAGVVRQHT